MKYCAIDTETHLIPSQGTTKVNLRHEIPDMVCYTWSTTDESAGLAMWDEHEPLFELLMRDDLTFLMHNVAFDLGVLSKCYPSLEGRLKHLVAEGRVLDTRMMYLLRHPDPMTKGVTLAYLAKTILHLSLSKGAERTSFRRGMTLTVAHEEYAIKDAVITRQIGEVLRRMSFGSVTNRVGTRQKFVAAHPLTDADDPDVLYSKAACYMAWYLVPHGMAIDRTTLEKFWVELSDEQGRLQAELVELGFARVQKLEKSQPEDLGPCPLTVPRRWTQSGVVPPTVTRRWKGRLQKAPGRVVKNEADIRAAFEAFAEDVEFSPKLSKKTKKVSLSRDDWREVEGLMPGELKTFMKYQRVSKYLSAFVKPLWEGRAQETKPNYWVHGAATGRWACSKPNLQQVPKANGMRGIYVARPDHVFLMADYPTLELYTLAHCMDAMGIQGPLMLALLSGEDIHSRTAALMYGVDLADVTKEQRQAAKASNFGLPGGMGVKRFHAESVKMNLGWDITAAANIRRLWLETYWDIAQYLQGFDCNPYHELKPPGMEAAEWLSNLGFDPDDTWPSRFALTQKVNDGAIYTCIYPGGRVLPERRYSAAANCFFQGTGADVITEAFNQCCKNDLPVCSVVHDSITLEVPNERSRIEGYSAELAEFMADALVTVCPSVPRPSIDVEVSEVWK